MDPDSSQLGSTELKAEWLMDQRTAVIRASVTMLLGLGLCLAAWGIVIGLLSVGLPIVSAALDRVGFPWDLLMAIAMLVVLPPAFVLLHLAIGLPWQKGLELFRRGGSLISCKHDEAEKIVRRALDGEDPFYLLLRSFSVDRGIDVDVPNDDPPSVQVRTGSAGTRLLRREYPRAVEEALMKIARLTSAICAIHNASDGRAEMLVPRLRLHDRHWTTAVQLIARRARGLIVFVDGRTEGVTTECSMIEEMGESAPQVLVVFGQHVTKEEARGMLPSVDADSFLDAAEIIRQPSVLETRLH